MKQRKEVYSMIDELFVDYDGIDDTILNLINNNDINSIYFRIYSLPKI